MKFSSKALAVRFTIFLLLFFITISIVDKLGVTQGWLKVHDPIEADLVILEGWISPRYYNKVISIFNKENYDKVLITGNTTNKSIVLYNNGSIIFKNFHFLGMHESLNRITLNSYGTYGNGEFSRYKLFKNDSLIFKKESVEEVEVSFDCSLMATDSLVVQFENDYYDGDFDRNLYINELKIGQETINLHSDMVWIYTKQQYANSIYYLQPKIASEEIISRGIPKDKVHLVISNNSKLSKTYGLAHEAVKWMDENNYSKANIISLSYHSKRTYLSFKKTNSEKEFGIISIDSNNSKLRTIKELLGNFFIRITPRFILEKDIKKNKSLDNR